MNRLDEIKSRLANATAGHWEYDSSRDTHDSCIYVEGATPDEYGYIDVYSGGGVVGSSEWICIKENDGQFIAHSKADVEWLIQEVERLSKKVGDNRGDGS